MYIYTSYSMRDIKRMCEIMPGIRSNNKYRNRIFARLSSLIIMASLLVATSLGAEQFDSVELKLSWAPVEAANGYIVQVESTDGEFKDEKKLKTNALSLNLAPGDYRLRLASMNKFGKAAAWTSWKPITLTGEEKVQSVQNLEKGEAAGVGPTLFQTSWIVPGLPRLLDSDWNDPYGYTWSAAFLIGAGGIAAEANRGNTIASDNLNDPVYLTLVFYNKPLPLLFYLKNRRDSEHASYDRSELNQQIMGSILAIAWIAHYVESYGKANGSDTPSEEPVGLNQSLSIAAGPHLDHRGRPDGISGGLIFRF